MDYFPEPQPEDPPPPLGRLARVSAGVLFLLLGLICALTAYVTTLGAERRGQYVLALVATLIAVALLLWAYRLLLDRPRKDGGLVSPATLCLFALVYIGLPIASFATGAWKNNRIPLPVLLPQAIMYIGWGVAMWRLAARRHSARARPHPLEGVGQSGVRPS